IEECELRGKPERNLARVERLRVLDSDCGGGAEDLALAASLGLLLGRVVNLLEDARHRQKEGRLERSERGEQQLRVGLVADLYATVNGEHRDEAREHVGEGDEEHRAR